MLQTRAFDGIDDPVVLLPNGPSEGECLLAHWDRDIRRAASVAAARPLKDARTEDVAQDARIQVFRAFQKGRPIAEGYIRRVVANAVRNSCRRETRALRLVDPKEPIELEAIGSDAVDESEDETSSRIADVAAWVHGLSTRLQTIFTLLYVQSNTQREAAELLGVSQPRVAQLHLELLRQGRLELAHLAA